MPFKMRRCCRPSYMLTPVLSFQSTPMKILQLGMDHVRILAQQPSHPLLKGLDHSLGNLWRRARAQGRVDGIRKLKLELQLDPRLAVAGVLDGPGVPQMRQQPHTPLLADGLTRMRVEMVLDLLPGQRRGSVPAHALDDSSRHAVDARGEALGQIAEARGQNADAGPCAARGRVWGGPVCYRAAGAIREEGRVRGHVGDYAVDWRAGVG